jgi:hypothetical protein
MAYNDSITLYSTIIVHSSQFNGMPVKIHRDDWQVLALIAEQIHLVNGDDLKAHLKTILKATRDNKLRHRLLKELDLGRTLAELLINKNGAPRFVLETAISLASDEEGVQALLPMNKCVLDMVVESLKRRKSWSSDKSTENMILLYLIRVSQYKEAAVELKSLNAIEILFALLEFGTQVAIDAFLVSIFITANSADGGGTYLKCICRVYRSTTIHLQHFPFPACHHTF